MDCDSLSSAISVVGEGTNVERVAAEGIDGYVSVLVEGVHLDSAAGGRIDVRVAFVPAD